MEDTIREAIIAYINREFDIERIIEDYTERSIDELANRTEVHEIIADAIEEELREYINKQYLEGTIQEYIHDMLN